LQFLNFINTTDYIKLFDDNIAGLLKFYEGSIQINSVKDITYSTLQKLYICFSYHLDETEKQYKQYQEALQKIKNGR